jgi:hypothetical protein
VDFGNVNFNGSDLREERSMSRTPERVVAARDAWLAAMAALEAHRLEANRLWLEYLELADPVRARKIRRILKHGEQGAAKTADELFPAAVSLVRSIPGPQELRHAASRNHPQIASTPLRGGVE